MKLTGTSPYPDFGPWFTELKRIGKLMQWTDKAVEGLDADDWKVYFDGELTPAQAWLEDISNG